MTAPRRGAPPYSIFALARIRLGFFLSFADHAFARLFGALSVLAFMQCARARIAPCRQPLEVDRGGVRRRIDIPL
jgi:hypothetical protein